MSGNRGNRGLGRRNSHLRTRIQPVDRYRENGLPLTAGVVGSSDGAGREATVSYTKGASLLAHQVLASGKKVVLSEERKGAALGLDQ